MISLLIKKLSGYDYKIFFWPYPVCTILYQVERDNHIRIQYPLPAANYLLRMLEDKVNSDWFFVVVLILFNG